MIKPFYEDSAVTIYHGDCREILPTLPKVDLVLTDPPYGLGKKLSGGSWGGTFHWDKVAQDLSSTIAAGKEVVIWGGNYFKLPLSRCWLIWSKPDAPPSMADFDMAWTSFDRPGRIFKYSISATNKERGLHPTPKPLMLISWCITLADNPQTILDPFMGSGTTLRAAKDLGRKAIGIELEEKYCEIAAKRMGQEVLDLGGQ